MCAQEQNITTFHPCPAAVDVGRLRAKTTKGDCAVAKNTGRGHRRGQVKDRYQVLNLITDLFDVFDGSGNYLRSKKSKGPWKGIEIRKAMKPPRR